jgi:hypothetical protein
MTGWNKIFHACGIHMKAREARLTSDKKKKKGLQIKSSAKRQGRALLNDKQRKRKA